MTGALALPANGLTVGTNQLTTNGGNVGIGTATADQLLHVEGGSDSVVKISATNAGSNAQIEFSRNGAGTWLGPTSDDTFDFWSSENIPMLFAVNNSEALRITSTGDVGIGTSSPAATLDVSGTLDDENAFVSRRNSGQYISTTHGASGNTIRSFSSTGNAKLLNIGSTTDESNSPVTAGTVGIKFDVLGNEAMRIEEDGNIGIGTSSPTSLLNVEDGSIELTQAGSVVPRIEINGAPSQTVPSLRIYNPDNTTYPYVSWTARDNDLFTVEGDSTDSDVGANRLFSVSETGAIEAPKGIQKGTTPIDGSGGWQTVTFSSEMASTPVVTATMEHTSGTPCFVVLLNVSTTSFDFKCVNVGTGSIHTGAQPVHWQAIAD